MSESKFRGGYHRYQEIQVSELRAGPIGNEANMESESNGPHRRVLNSGRIVVFLVLIGIAAGAWPQQTPLGSPNVASPALLSPTLPSPTLVASADLPDAPGAQASHEQSSPGSIHGVVADPEGTVYEGVRIELAQTDSTQPVR